MTAMNHRMAEATRLTREGRLKEAMALLQGGPVEAPDAPKAEAGPRGAPPVIDMVPPVDGAGAWRSPETAAQAPKAGARAEGRAEGLAGSLAETLAKSLPGGLSGGASSGAGLAAKLPGGLRMPGGMQARGGVAVPEGAIWEERAFANAAGSRPYKLYVPSRRTEGQALPLVVMLHGCTQSPDDFAAGTRMNEVAEELGFLVAYPGQTQAANMQKCWNWFNPADQRRDGGEPSLIAGITREVMAEFGAPRAFVAGLSAGGAKAAIMGEAYPELYAAVGVHSGLACGAARDVGSAFGAMRSGGGASGAAEVPVPTIVFHGDRDQTVHPVNGDEVLVRAGSREGHRTEVEQGQSDGGMGWTRTAWRDAAGRLVLEQWVLHGAGHAWSGGSAQGSYTDPSGPDASREMARFFLGQPVG